MHSDKTNRDTLECWLANRWELIDQLHADADAAQWDISKEIFSGALMRSLAHRFPGSKVPAVEAETYLHSLHLKDLALACACSEGREPAWEYFFTRYRNYLYAAAAAVMRLNSGDPRARELADNLYAELYGAGRGTIRRSLFSYFHGRSKLETWLRVLLAQRFVDKIRSEKRLEPIGEKTVNASTIPPPGMLNLMPADPDRERYLSLLRTALDSAFASLEAPDHRRLRLYYAEGRTLAQIGQHLGEHESTVSRRLERIRRHLRDSVERILRTGIPAVNGKGKRPGLSDEQIGLCFEYALQDWPFDLDKALSASKPPIHDEENS
jgi:RNA polymerase sigma-70 factor